jgi:hypothetical protein
MHALTPLFAELFHQEPLPLQGVEILALQLCCLHSQEAMWQAFQEAARAAPHSTQQALEDWLQNHWNQLSRTVVIPDYEQAVMAALAQEITDGAITITGVSPQVGLLFTRSTEA